MSVRKLIALVPLALCAAPLVAAQSAYGQVPPIFPESPSDFGGAQPLNKSKWFSADDYPMTAQAAHHTGTVDISFAIGVNGKVSDCRVVRSSGYKELDAATCRLFTKRARFQPAVDANNVPQPTTGTTTVPWRLWP